MLELPETIKVLSLVVKLLLQFLILIVKVSRIGKDV